MSLVPDGMRSDVTMAMPLRAVCETSMCGCACTCCDRNEAALAEHGEQRRVRATERNDDAKGLKSRMTCEREENYSSAGTDVTNGTEGEGQNNPAGPGKSPPPPQKGPNRPIWARRSLSPLCTRGVAAPFGKMSRHGEVGHASAMCIRVMTSRSLRSMYCFAKLAPFSPVFLSVPAYTQSRNADVPYLMSTRASTPLEVRCICCHLLTFVTTKVFVSIIKAFSTAPAYGEIARRLRAAIRWRRKHNEETGCAHRPVSGRLQSDAESDDANLGLKYRSLLGGVKYASIATIATMDG